LNDVIYICAIQEEYRFLEVPPMKLVRVQRGIADHGPQPSARDLLGL
jgi:hypothetical protein